MAEREHVDRLHPQWVHIVRTLLEALKLVLTQAEALAPTLSTLSYARAAIAKAEGREPAS